MIGTVYTHPGSAHRDEFIAAALLVAAHRADTIMRQARGPNKHPNSGAIILDQGGSFDMTLDNLDHHQMKPNETDLRRFEESDNISAVNTPHLFQGLYSLGDGLLAHYRELDARLSMLAARATMRTVGEYLVVQPNIERGSSPLYGLEPYCKELETSIGRRVEVTVVPDDRGSGLALYRRYDSCGINFHLLADDPRTLFAHQGGFILKSRYELPESEVDDLIRLATVD